MKNKMFLFLIFTLAIGVNSYGQTDNISVIDNINSIPQEKIFVHHNSSFFLSGESLFYKIYCLNTQTTRLSDISKIAYIELIDKNHTIIFKHKIKLETGMGQGDYFISSSVPSGNYKLIAYTQWMKNGDTKYLFQSDISIINPFQSNQNEILKEFDTLNTLKTVSQKRINNIPKIKYSSASDNLIDLELSESTFLPRKKVLLNINSLNDSFAHGNYSLSIRKIDTLDIPVKITSKAFLKNNYENQPSFNNKYVFLPELRGELISGKVTFKDSNLPASDVKVGLSIPGKNYLFKISNTNRLGVFYFNLDKNVENSTAIFQVIHDNFENYRIDIDASSPIDYSDIVFNEFKIPQNTKNMLLQHSIYNQIENAYQNIKLDSVENFKNIDPFYTSKAEEFLLDDFTRFPTIKETIIEIISSVYIKNKGGDYSLHVRIYGEGLVTTSDSPLVIVDGNLVQNQNDLVLYNPKNVKKISVISEQYVYGLKIFKGIISIETFDGSYQHNVTGDYIKIINLKKPLLNKNYYNQIYSDSSKFNHIPDYRSQLLWEPNFNLNRDQSNIVFYTSDNIGEYEICLEGFTKDGKPISIREKFNVE